MMRRRHGRGASRGRGGQFAAGTRATTLVKDDDLLAVANYSGGAPTHQADGYGEWAQTNGTWEYSGEWHTTPLGLQVAVGSAPTVAAAETAHGDAMAAVVWGYAVEDCLNDGTITSEDLPTLIPIINESRRGAYSGIGDHDGVGFSAVRLRTYETINARLNKYHHQPHTQRVGAHLQQLDACLLPPALPSPITTCVSYEHQPRRTFGSMLYQVDQASKPQRGLSDGPPKPSQSQVNARLGLSDPSALSDLYDRYASLAISVGGPVCNDHRQWSDNSMGSWPAAVMLSKAHALNNDADKLTTWMKDRGPSAPDHADWAALCDYASAQPPDDQDSKAAAACLAAAWTDDVDRRDSGRRSFAQYALPGWRKTADQAAVARLDSALTPHYPQATPMMQSVLHGPPRRRRMLPSR